MHKVFINNKLLSFTTVKSSEANALPYQNEADFHQAIAMLSDSNKDVNIYHPNIEEVWKEFKKSYKKIYAAGGVVFNPKEEILWIYRLGKWDLPKGKMEKDEKKKETAIREVEEECGIKGLEITRKLSPTYHMYYHKKWILKITYWYEMKYGGSTELVPQEEEGITKAEWISMSSIHKPLENTYANISNLLRKYY